MEAYWTFVCLTAFGECQVKSIANAQVFFHRVFLEQHDPISDRIIQQQLIESARSSADNGDRVPAELCLRCLISHQIQLACQRLAKNFGNEHGFCVQDLRPFVLDDVLPSQTMYSQQTDYQSFATRLLQTFDPQRSSLNTWVDLHVRQHPELHRFLLECGVYLASPWGILNETSILQLQKMPSAFYCKLEIDTQSACLLLQAYHSIYRQDRLAMRQNGQRRSQCQPPTLEQLQCIAQLLQSQGYPFPCDPDSVLSQLQNLADDLRQYYISRKTGRVPIKSGDGDLSSIADHRTTETDDEEAAFLTRYRQQLLACLDEAIIQVTEMRVNIFQNKKTAKAQEKGRYKAQQFLKALELFLCDGISMAEIARQLGLKGQYSVSNLLELKAFRADVRHYTLGLLRDRILELAAHYTDPNHLRDLDRHLDHLLGEQIDQILQEAEKRIHQNRPTDSIFAHRLCRYLDKRKFL
jgi:hypothetical protein